MIRVRFQRFAKDNSAPLVVNFTTTMASADFEQTADRAVMESGTVTIPAGENAVEVVLAAISEDPAANEGIEIFTVTVTPGTYDVVQTAAGFDKKNVLSVNYERKYYILEGVTLFATPDPAVEPDIFIDDILQGGVNDCFALAAMGALILENPERLRSLFTTIDDTHYVVKLYDATAGEWKDISVTVDLTRGINMAKVTGDVDPATGKAEIWPIVLEQAYAQLAGGYAVLEQGGLSPGVWTALTGVSATTVSPGTSDDAIGQQIVNALKGPKRPARPAGGHQHLRGVRRWSGFDFKGNCRFQTRLCGSRHRSRRWGNLRRNL